MKPNKVLIYISTVATLVFGGCCRSRIANIIAGNPNRVVTISPVTAGDFRTCEVDFPVSLLRIGKHHTIAWAGDSHEYWVVFENAPGPLAAAPILPIHVPQDASTGPYSLAQSNSEKYYKYAIYYLEPTANPNAICKTADDDRDTGL